MTQQSWTDEDRGFLASHEGWTAQRIAEELGRTTASVHMQRTKLRKGWQPQYDKGNAWTKTEDDFVIATRQWKSGDVGEQLGRSAKAVQRRRFELRHRFGVSVTFNGNHDPHRAGCRPLIAKTCKSCGKMRQASWFRLKTKTGSWTSRCEDCRDRTGERQNNSDRAVTQRKASMARFQALTVGGADRAGQPYTDADFAVLADPDLTVLEKALKIHRTYRATVIACSRNDYRSKRGLGEPSNQWIVHQPGCPSVAA